MKLSELRPILQELGRVGVVSKGKYALVNSAIALIQGRVNQVPVLDIIIHTARWSTIRDLEELPIEKGILGNYMSMDILGCKVRLFQGTGATLANREVSKEGVPFLRPESTIAVGA